jgi:CRP-like cAMP-binding protein
MRDSMVADLKAVPLFQAVNDRDLGALARRARVRAYPKDRLVFKEGAVADSLYVIVSGSVKIFLNDDSGTEVVLDTKTAGQYFGEMMLDHRPRSASVVTLEPSEFAVISRNDFKAFLRKHPDAAEQVILNLIRVARGMNQRTREVASLGDRLREYIKWLEEIKAPDLPSVKRWLVAKRWVLGGLLTLSVAQFYFLDVFLQILSLGGLTVFTGR